MNRLLPTCWAVIGLLLAAPLFAQAPNAGSQPATPAQAKRATTLDRNYTTFPQQTRKLASPDVLARGKGIYSVNCNACHGADLRGGDQGGPNLLRSLTALSDQHGELISPIIHGARQDKGCLHLIFLMPIRPPWPNIFTVYWRASDRRHTRRVRSRSPIKTFSLVMRPRDKHIFKQIARAVIPLLEI